MDPFSVTSADSASTANLSYRDRVSTLHHPPSMRVLVRRLGRNGAIVLGFIVANLGVGAVGYHAFAGLPWLDATLNAAMILTGMGPVDRLVEPQAKVFAIVYSLFSSVFFLTMVAVLLAPAVQHFLHRFHLELDERRETSAGDDARQPRRPATACSLPVADRSQRTADFRALLADAFRRSGAIGWRRPLDAARLRSDRGGEPPAGGARGALLRRRPLRGGAARRSRAVGRSRARPEAQATLDAFYELPVLVRSDEGARALWDALDGAACGPPATSRSPTP